MNILWMHSRIMALFLALAVLQGCGAAANADEELTLCESAAVHVSSCVESGQGDLEPAAPTGACDEEQAAQMLELDCAAIRGSMLDGKADSFVQQRADFACALGLYAMCTVPTCEPDADEPDVAVSLPPLNPEQNDEEDPEVSACAEEALAYQGCGACSYYTCLEQEMGCGADGYLLRFANAYCLRYRLVSEPLASADAAGWLMRVRQCLIKELDQALPVADCDALEREGLESHARCYVSTGFCELTVSDWWLVLSTIKASDWSFRDMLLVGHDCVAHWLDGGE